MRRIHQIYIISLLSITALAFAQVSVNPMNASPISSVPMPNSSNVQSGPPASPNTNTMPNNINAAPVDSNATMQPVSNPFPMNTLDIERPADAAKSSKPSTSDKTVKTNSLDNGLNATQGVPSEP